MTHEHLVWRIKLHVFSPEMAKQLEDHRKALYAAHAKLFAVAQFRDRIERLRSNDDAALQRVVKRFDEIAVPAKLEADRLATIPFANLSSSLSVEPATPCVVAPMR